MDKNLEKSIRQFVTYAEREEDAQTAIDELRKLIDCVKSSTHAQIIQALENVAYDFSLNNELCPECVCKLVLIHNEIKCPKCKRSY